jgi:hypothetical protein
MPWTLLKKKRKGMTTKRRGYGWIHSACTGQESTSLLIPKVYHYYPNPEDNMILIDRKRTVRDIKNFTNLPKHVQGLILTADRIEPRQFQELVGYKDRKLIFDAGGHWQGRHFVIESIGGKEQNENVTWRRS